MTNTTRRLDRKDLSELAQLCREHASYERAEWMEFDRREKLGAMLLDQNDAFCWVTEGEGELAGFATAFIERSTWDANRFLHLDCLFLRSAYRGRGLGRQMVAEVARKALELSLINVQWQTPDWNLDAARFYRRLGALSANKLRFQLSAESCATLLHPTGSR